MSREPKSLNAEQIRAKSPAIMFPHLSPSAAKRMYGEALSNQEGLERDQKLRLGRAQEFWSQMDSNIPVYMRRLRDYRLNNSSDQSSQGFKVATDLNGRTKDDERDRAVYVKMVSALKQKIKENNSSITVEGDTKGLRANNDAAKREITQLELDLGFLKGSFIQHIVHDKGLDREGVENSSDVVVMLNDIPRRALGGDISLSGLLRLSSDKTNTGKFATERAQLVLSGGDRGESAPFSLTPANDGEYYGEYGRREKAEIAFGVVMQQEKLNFRHGYTLIESGYRAKSPESPSKTFSEFAQDLLTQHKESTAHQGDIVMGSLVDFETKDVSGFAGAVESILMDISKGKTLSEGQSEQLQQHFTDNPAVKLSIYDNTHRGKIMQELDSESAQELFSRLDHVTAITHEIIGEVLQGQQERHEEERKNSFVARVATRKPVRRAVSRTPSPELEGSTVPDYLSAAADSPGATIFSSRKNDLASLLALPVKDSSAQVPSSLLSPLTAGRKVKMSSASRRLPKKERPAIVTAKPENYEGANHLHDLQKHRERYYRKYKGRFGSQEFTTEECLGLRSWTDKVANFWDYDIGNEAMAVFDGIRDLRKSHKDDPTLDLRAAFQTLITDADIQGLEAKEGLYEKLVLGLKKELEAERLFRKKYQQKRGPLFSRSIRSPSSESTEVTPKMELESDLKFLEEAFFADKEKELESIGRKDPSGQFHLVQRIGGDSFDKLQALLEGAPKVTEFSTHLIWSGNREETTPDDPLYHGSNSVEFGIVYDQEKVDPTSVTMVHCSYPMRDGNIRPQERKEGPYPIAPLVFPIEVAAKDFYAKYHESKFHHQKDLKAERLEFMRTMVHPQEDEPIKSSVSSIFIDISHCEKMKTVDTVEIEEYFRKNSDITLLVYDSKVKSGDTMRELTNEQAKSFMLMTRRKAGYNDAYLTFRDIDGHLRFLDVPATNRAAELVKAAQELQAESARIAEEIKERETASDQELQAESARIVKTPRTSDESVSGPTPPPTPEPPRQPERKRRVLPDPPVSATPAKSSPWQPPASSTSVAPVPTKSDVPTPPRRSTRPGVSPAPSGSVQKLAGQQVHSPAPNGGTTGKDLPPKKYIDYSAKVLMKALGSSKSSGNWGKAVEERRNAAAEDRHSSC